LGTVLTILPVQAVNGRAVAIDIAIFATVLRLQLQTGSDQCSCYLATWKGALAGQLQAAKAGTIGT
jgi:hypothetical protein